MQRFIAVLSVFLFGVVGAAQDVTYNYDRDADFKGFKTYAWVEVTGAGVQRLDPLTEKQVMAAIDTELRSKGLEVAPESQADLLVAYQVATRAEQSVAAYSSGWGYGPGWYGAGGITTTETTTIYVGQLVLDMYDKSKKQLVWRG